MTRAAPVPGAAPSVELRAVIACAQSVVDGRARPWFDATLAACPSADRLRRAACAQGMLGHLHRLAADVSGERCADEDTVRLLAQWHGVAARRSLRQTAILLRILRAFGEAGVTAMPFKGPAWAQRLYGDIALRTWSDLDLLVPWGQALEARKVLLGMGYSDAVRFGARLIRRRRGIGAMHLFSASLAVSCDLHWEVSHGFDAVPLPAERILSRAVPLQLLGRPVPSPSLVDMLIITCLEGSHDRWNTVERILALGVQVRDHPAAAWPEMLDAAREAGCGRRVCVSVAHACRVLGLAVPGPVTAELGGDRLGRAMLAWLTPESLASPLLAPEVAGFGARTLRSCHGRASASPALRCSKAVRGLLPRVAWAAGAEDTLDRTARRASARLFRPSVEDWASLALPSGWEWLYYPWRPVRLAGKYARQRTPSSGRGRG